MNSQRRWLLTLYSTALFLASHAEAADFKLAWGNPCVKADSVQCDTLSAVPENGLAAIDVYGVRFSDSDTLFFGSIPEIGRECLGDSALYSVHNGTVGALLYYTRNVTGKRSCTYASYVFAFPADSTWQLKPGLTGTYFSDQNLTQLLGTRVDSMVNFDWGTGVALAGMPSDWFSVRWVGKIQIPTTGAYAFTLRLNDAGRLWVGAANVIDNWGGDGDHSVTGLANLQAGSQDLRIEMYEKTGSARTTLYWTPPGVQSEQVVPASALSH